MSIIVNAVKVPVSYFNAARKAWMRETSVHVAHAWKTHVEGTRGPWWVLCLPRDKGSPQVGFDNDFYITLHTIIPQVLSH